jgi:hypothetical protein
MTFGHGLRSILIECVCVPLVGLFKVRSDVIEIDLFIGLYFSLTDIGFFDEEQRMPFDNDVTFRDV